MKTWKSGIPDHPIPPNAQRVSPFVGSKYEKASLSDFDLDPIDSEIISGWLSNPHDIFFIYSNPGVGKTHLSAAITHHFLQKNIPCLYLKEKDFINKLREQINDGFSEEQYLKYMCENPLIILDDICSARTNSADDRMTEWHKDMLFTFLDYRVNSRSPTIITSNYSIDDLRKWFHERFISRLKAANNTILPLKGGDKRQEGL